MLNELLLLSKNDIPFPQGQITIHCPTIREIGLIGESAFFHGSKFLTFSKDKMLSAADKSNTINKSDFDILMSIIINGNQGQFSEIRESIHFVLQLMFPTYNINFNELGIVLADLEEQDSFGFINNDNFNDFREIVKEMFCLNRQNDGNKEYNVNPNSVMGNKILQKLQAAREKRNALKGHQGNQKVSILNRYVSILAVGENKSINDLLDYTVYQLFDEYDRYILKLSYDHYFSARLAGAKDMKDPDDWMKDLYSDDSSLD